MLSMLGSLSVVLWCVVSSGVNAMNAHPWIAQERNDSLRETWHHKHESLLNQTAVHGSTIAAVFLGDSITEMWKTHGEHVWAAHYGNRHAYNYGISADHTEHVLWRITAGGELANVHPKVVVLMIGTNNLNKGDHPGDTAMAIFVIVDELRRMMPHTKVIVVSILPRQSTALDTEVHQTNALIARFADNVHVHYLDMTKAFETGLGHEREQLFVADHVHPSEKGYEVWYKTMEPLFAKLMA